MLPFLKIASQILRAIAVLRNRDLSSQQRSICPQSQDSSPRFALLHSEMFEFHRAENCSGNGGIFPKHTYFFFTNSHGPQCKYLLVFNPDEAKDHTVDLVVVTEREKFLIPVSAIGPRGSFTLPDLVDFGPCAVRSESFKTLLVRNLGNVAAGFAISNEMPFFASPQTAMLKPDEAVQVTISFIPDYLEEHCSELRVEYNTGEVNSHIPGSPPCLPDFFGM